ncbi:hypothetical protein PENARI_c003G01336, partial [Penicillium arizonense]
MSSSRFRPTRPHTPTTKASTLSSLQRVSASADQMQFWKSVLGMHEAWLYLHI